MKRTLTLLTALLLAPLAALHAAEVDDLLARCQVTKTSPTAPGSAGGYGTMNQCLLLGNGNLMVSVAGGPETITLFLGKTDFWRDRGHGKVGTLWQSGNVLPGWLNLTFPAMKGAKFEQVQDMALAEVRTKLTKGSDVIEVRSVTPHEADNFIISDIANKGAVAVEVDPLGQLPGTAAVVIDLHTMNTASAGIIEMNGNENLFFRVFANVTYPI